MPYGPLLGAAGVFVIATLISWAFVRRAANGVREARADLELATLRLVVEEASDEAGAALHAVVFENVLRAMGREKGELALGRQTAKRFREALDRLCSRGLLEKTPPNLYVVTKRGREVARQRESSGEG